MEKISGKTRAATAAAILQNGEMLEKAYNASLDSAGSSADAMDTALTSIESHVNQLHQSLSIMWENAIPDEVIKGFVDFTNLIVKGTNKIGLWTTAFTALAGVMGAKGLGGHKNQSVSFEYA